jgi:hypothetical protein
MDEVRKPINSVNFMFVPCSVLTFTCKSEVELDVNLNNIYYLFPTSQKTHHVSTTKTSQLMLLRLVMSVVYSDDYTTHITPYLNKLWSFLMLK